MKPLKDDLRYTINGTIVGLCIGLIVSQRIPMSFLPSQDFRTPSLAILLVGGAIIGMVIGVVFVMVMGLLRRWCN